MDAAKVLLFAWFWVPSVVALVLLLARSVECVTDECHCTDEGQPDGCCMDQQESGR